MSFSFYTLFQITLLLYGFWKCYKSLTVAKGDSDAALDYVRRFAASGDIDWVHARELATESLDAAVESIRDMSTTCIGAGLLGTLIEIKTNASTRLGSLNGSADGLSAQLVSFLQTSLTPSLLGVGSGVVLSGFISVVVAPRHARETRDRLARLRNMAESAGGSAETRLMTIAATIQSALSEFNESNRSLARSLKNVESVMFYAAASIEEIPSILKEPLGQVADGQSGLVRALDAIRGSVEDLKSVATNLQHLDNLPKDISRSITDSNAAVLSEMKTVVKNAQQGMQDGISQAEKAFESGVDRIARGAQRASQEIGGQLGSIVRESAVEAAKQIDQDLQELRPTVDDLTAQLDRLESLAPKLDGVLNSNRVQVEGLLTVMRTEIASIQAALQAGQPARSTRRPE